MLQQTLALLILAFFLGRLILQKKKGQIGGGEFFFWLFFWLSGLLAIANLKELDKFSAQLGFSSSGIDILIYLSILTLFYLIFKIRLRMAKQDRALTKLTRKLALLEAETRKDENLLN